MIRRKTAGPAEPLRERVIAFVTGAAVSARCAGCLALGLGVSLAEARAAMHELEHDPRVAVRMTTCSSCGRRLETVALKTRQ